MNFCHKKIKEESIYKDNGNKKRMSEQKYVVDTSVVIEKAVSKLIKEKKI